MKLEVADFHAFRAVCKSWRSPAVSNKNKFIESRPPVSVSKIYYAPSLYYLADRICIGETCGYLILFREKTADIWLLNPITMNKLHIQDIPNDLFCCPANISAILVFSPSISGYVFVVFSRCYNRKIWFCTAGTREWSCILTDPFPIHDLIAFKGKIYTVHSVYGSDELRLCEMKLYPEPKSVLLETQGFPNPNFKRPGFVTCGENLYLIDHNTVSEYPYKIHVLDLDEMKWASCERKGKEYDFFLYDFKLCDNYLHYARYVFNNINGIGRLGIAKIYYFFHSCMNVDILHD